MSREDIVAVAVRLFALALLLFVGWTGLAMAAAAGWSGKLLAVTLPLLGIAALLWTFPLSVARRLLPVMRDERPPLTASASDVQAVAFTVLGLWLLFGAFSDAIYWLSLAFVARRDPEIPVTWTPEQTASVVATIVEAALAIALLLGSHGLQRALQKLRGR